MKRKYTTQNICGYKPLKTFNLNALNEELEFISRKVCQVSQLVAGDFDSTISFSVNTNPNSGGTTFDPDTQQSQNVVYVSAINGSQWTWNGSSYVTYRPALKEISDKRIITGFHTAFGVSAYVEGNVVLVQSEGAGHALVAGTKPVIYLSTDNGETYVKSYLPLTGIPGAASNDIRNLAGGADDSGKIWFFGTDYVGASEAVPSKLWYWTSTDAGVTFSNPVQITYNTSTYDLLTVYGQLTDLGNGTLIVPAYGSKGTLAESYAVQLKSIDNGVTWATSNIYTGDITSTGNYITETDIFKVSSSLLLAIGRREIAKPRLFSSIDGGTTWVSQGIITSAVSSLYHAPYFYKDGNRVYCIFSDRVNNNVARLSVNANYATLSEWNNAKSESIVGSIIQTGFGSYNFGYCSVLNTGIHKKLVWYDIALEEDNPASLDNALTHLLVTKIDDTPTFTVKADTNQVYTAGAEELITFDETLLVDNKGGFDSTNNTYTIKEDGLYLLSCNLRLSSIAFAAITQLTIYSRYNVSVERLVMQGGNLGQGNQYDNVNAVVPLRAGEILSFKLYNSNASNVTVNVDTPPWFSIVKIK